MSVLQIYKLSANVMAGEENLFCYVSMLEIKAHSQQTAKFYFITGIYVMYQYSNLNEMNMSLLQGKQLSCNNLFRHLNKVKTVYLTISMMVFI